VVFVPGHFRDWHVIHRQRFVSGVVTIGLGPHGRSQHGCKNTSTEKLRVTIVVYQSWVEIVNSKICRSQMVSQLYEYLQLDFFNCANITLDMVEMILFSFFRETRCECATFVHRGLRQVENSIELSAHETRPLQLIMEKKIQSFGCKWLTADA